MNRRQVIEGVAAASAGVGLAGCSGGPSYRYRYRFTLEAEVDGKMLSAFNVAEDWARTSSFPEKRIVNGTIGEAMVMEFRPGKVLVPLLSVVTQVPDPVRGGNWTRQRGLWRAFYNHYGFKREHNEDHFPFMKRWLHVRGERELPFDDLPDLVTFDDINDPRTVKLVDPRNLEASFGLGVVLKRATIAIVDNDTPLTKGIEKKLPWIVALGSKAIVNFGTTRMGTTNLTLMDKLHGGHFKEGV